MKTLTFTATCSLLVGRCFPKTSAHCAAELRNQMATLDYIVLGTYFLVILGVGLWAGRGEKSAHDYFLGSGRQPWLVVGLSILATQLSAMTFIAVPGTAFASDCSYLQYYFGAFLGQLAIVWLLLPAFYGGRVTTVYEYLGTRFGPWSRSVASILFFVSRIVGSGLRLLIASIAIGVVFDWPLVPVIVASAAAAVAYTTFGGIKAIIWTDAVQVCVFVAGAVAAVVYMFIATPGSAMENLATAADAGKFHVFNWNLDLLDDTAFVVLLIHTFFLNAAVFGADQDLTHRMLTCASLRDGQRSLTFNAIIGFPVVALFLLVGVMMFVFFGAHPELAPDPTLRSDYVFPQFIAGALPAGWGLRGLLVAGVFAAAMSSLDSALGALSATAVIDFYKPYFARDRSTEHYVRAGRLFVLLFGVLLTLVAILFIEQSELLYEAFKWASLIFGSLLGVFLLGVLTKTRGDDRVNAVAMISGVALLAAIKYSQDPEAPTVPWPWWIVIGTVWTFAIGVLFVGRNVRDSATVTVE
jgi:solute:Na+ symporter, SSS family